MFGYSSIPVYYYRCLECEFLFTDFFAGWTHKDFSEYIYNADYDKVDGDYAEARPRRDGKFFSDMLQSYRGLSVLDYGGGAGVLAAMLRDSGIDAECYDPFSSPDRPERCFDVITCMEVLEHSPDPVATLHDMAGLLNTGGCILVGTGLQPDDIDILRANWWYVAPRNGHMSIQSSASLISLGIAVGLVSYQGQYLHGFASTPSPVSTALLERIGRPTVDLVLSAPEQGCSIGSALACNPADWHDIENGQFRWTARSEIVWSWTPTIAPCDVQLRIPYIMAIQPDFLQQSKIVIDQDDIQFILTPRSMKAKISIKSSEPLVIRLVTPSLPSARDVNGCSDDRRLGVALLLRTARDPLLR